MDHATVRRLRRQVTKDLPHRLRLTQPAAGGSYASGTGLPVEGRSETVVYDGPAFVRASEEAVGMADGRIQLEGDATVRLRHGALPIPLDAAALTAVTEAEGVRRTGRVTEFARRRLGDYVGVTFSGPGVAAPSNGAT